MVVWMVVGPGIVIGFDRVELLEDGDIGTLRPTTNNPKGI